MSVPSPVTLAEFKTHLNLATNTAESDTELTLHLQAATEVVEQRVGPLVTREFTEAAEGRGGYVVVNKTPLVQVTSLTEVAGNVAWAAAEYTADASGVITGALGRRLPRGRYTVVYTAGRGAAPADPMPANLVPDRFRLAVLYVGEHLWEMQRKSAGRPGLFGEAREPGGSSEAAAAFVYRGFALPKRALELLAGDEELGFA